MKKTILALAALALVGCAKEAARTEVVEPAPVATGRVVTITAAIDPVTKTAYDEEGKFAWVAGDKIGVMVFNEDTDTQVVFTADAAGAITTFTGVVPEGYKIGNYASYPFEGHDGYLSNDLAWYKSNGEDYGWRLWGSVQPDLENPLASTPLIGTRIEDSQSFTFKTATAIVKFTVENVPMDTYFAYLTVPGESDANLNGWYNLTAEGYLSMADAVEPWKDRYNWNAPTEINSTMEYYFFIPVGTLPAGTQFQLCDSNYSAIFSAEFRKDVEAVRNAVINIAPIVLEPTPTFTLEDILGVYDMTVTAGDYGNGGGQTVSGLVIEASDNELLGNIMITKFAGVEGKQYGNFDGVNMLTFSCDQLFAANPYEDAATRPYIALDFYNSGIGVVDPQFLVQDVGKIKGLSDAMGFRTCTEIDWLGDPENPESEVHGGGWPWALCYGSLVATWHVDAPEEPGSTGEDLNDPVEVDPWTE